MNRDHLRLVAANSAPCGVTRLETITFAKVEGGLVILHNEKRITPLAAMDVLLQLGEMAAIALDGPRSDERQNRRRLPGDLVGAELADEDPLFPENRHQLGYPLDGPKPVCAETDGDGA